VVRRAITFLLTILLAWADLLLLPLVDGRVILSGLRAVGLHGTVLRVVGVGGWTILLPAVIYVVACWLTWTLAPGVRSPYKWMALALGVLRLLLAIGGMILLPLNHYWTWMGWDMWLPTLFSFLLTVAAVLVLCEPHSSAPLTRRDRLIAYGSAVLGGYLLVLSPAATFVVPLTGVLVYAVSGLLEDAGFTASWRLYPIWFAGAAWLSYLFARTLISGIRARRVKASIGLDTA